MAIKLIIKNKNTNPGPGNLAVGELGYNNLDKQLFIGNGGAAPIPIPTGYKIKIVTSLPTNPQSDTIYFIKE